MDAGAADRRLISTVGCTQSVGMIVTVPSLGGCADSPTDS